jgi:hypothetical protein
VFNGAVVGNGVDSTLVLGSALSAGTLSGLGSQFTGFSAVTEADGAVWTLGGDAALGASTSLSIGGQLMVVGQLSDRGAAVATADGTLTVANGVAVMSQMSLAGGTLAAAATGECVVGRSAALGKAGAIVIDGGVTLGGFGAVGGDAAAGLIDYGTIAATGGLLTLESAVSGAGTVTIAAGATLLAENQVAVRDVVFEAGGQATLVVDAGAGVTSIISGFGTADTIDLQGSTIASVVYSKGTLVLENGEGVATGSLRLSGHYTTAEFTLTPDTEGGTSIAFNATARAVASEHSGLLDDFLPSHLGAAPAIAVAKTGALAYGSVFSGDVHYVMLHHSGADSHGAVQ